MGGHWVVRTGGEEAFEIEARWMVNAAGLHAQRVAAAAYQGGETDITDLIDGYRAGAEARTNAIDLAERALKTRADHLLALEGEER